jgi:hypothetical protein
MDFHLAMKLPTISITPSNYEHNVFWINGNSLHVKNKTVSYTIHTATMLYPYIILKGIIGIYIVNVFHKFITTE